MKGPTFIVGLRIYPSRIGGTERFFILEAYIMCLEGEG